MFKFSSFDLEYLIFQMEYSAKACFSVFFPIFAVKIMRFYTEFGSLVQFEAHTFIVASTLKGTTNCCQKGLFSFWSVIPWLLMHSVVKAPGYNSCGTMRNFSVVPSMTSKEST